MPATGGSKPAGRSDPARSVRDMARERPVADLVAEIRRYHSGLIVLRGKRLAEQPVTGIFDMSDPARALDLIAASQGAALHRFSPWILILDGG